MYKSRIKLDINYQEFKNKYENQKSQNKVVIDSINHIKNTDYELVWKFINDNIDDLSRNTISILLKISLNKSKIYEFMGNYFSMWLRIAIKKNVNVETLKDILTKNLEKIKNTDSEIINNYIDQFNSDDLSSINETLNNYESFTNYIDSNNYDDGIKKFNEIKTIDLKQSKMSFWLAEYFLLKQDYEETRELINYCLAAKPKNSKFINFELKLAKFKPIIPIKLISDIKIVNPYIISKLETKTIEVKRKIIDWNSLTKDELIRKYNLKMLKFQSIEFIKTVVENKEENAGYISYFNKNKKNKKFLMILFFSKYKLDDDTRTGYVKALNKFTFMCIEEGDFNNAFTLNNLALSDKPNNNDALDIKIEIIKQNTLNQANNNVVKKIKIKKMKNKSIREKLFEKLEKRKEEKYIDIVKKFMIKNKKNIAMQKDISKRLSFLCLDIKQILRPYIFKIEDKIIALAELHGYINNNKTTELYNFMDSYEGYDVIINETIFNTNTLGVESHSSYSIFSKTRNKDLYIILKKVFRNIRNFLVHSHEGIFNYKYSVYYNYDQDSIISKLDDPNHDGSNLNNCYQYKSKTADFLDDLEENRIIQTISTEEGREEHNIFHLILVMLLLTNDSKIAFSILSQIDYMLYVFICSIDRDAQQYFYNAIGLKFNWFNNVVSLWKIL